MSPCGTSGASTARGHHYHLEATLISKVAPEALSSCHHGYLHKFDKNTESSMKDFSVLVRVRMSA
jgi:hypothetical protein